MSLWYTEQTIFYREALDSLEASSEKTHSFQRKPIDRNETIWSFFQKKDAPDLRPAFWKIHISVAPSELNKMFDFIKNILCNQSVHFKLPNSLLSFMSMNDSSTLPSQLGKTVTIYPRDENELIKLYDISKEFWNKGLGTRIASDLYEDVNVPVSIRYGQCGSVRTQVDACGRTVNLLPIPDGREVPERRSEFGETPWGSQSCQILGRIFKHIELASPKELNLGLHVYKIKRRYGPWFKQTLHVEDRNGESWCIKRVHKGSCVTKDGSTAECRLYQELVSIRDLSIQGKVPSGAFSCEDTFFSYLAFRWQQGQSLTELNDPIDEAVLLRIVRLIRDFHDGGYIHRDIKPTNIIYNRTTDELSLIDFETAVKIGTHSKFTYGTEGYRPPEYDKHDLVAHSSYDVYSLGVLILQCLTGINPGDQLFNADTIEAVLKVNGYSRLSDMVILSISSEASTRPSLEMIERALSFFKKCKSNNIEWSENNTSEAHSVVLDACFATREFRQEDKNGFFWKSNHPFASPNDMSINTGSSGTILGLTLIRQLLSVKHFDEDIEGGLKYLQNSHFNEHVSGMFVGMAGAAIALCLGGKDFNNTSFIKRSEELLGIACNNAQDPDLFFGGAGIVQAAVVCASLTGSKDILVLVKPLVEKLYKDARKYDDMVCWVPSGILDKSLIPKTSVSHGTIGIALALNNWCAATKSNDEIMQLSEEAFLSVYQNALNYGCSGIKHEVVKESAMAPDTIWCRGLSGFQWALLRMQKSYKFKEKYLEASKWSENKIFSHKISGNPTMCHGLAGSLDLLIDLLAVEDQPHEHKLLERATTTAYLLLKNAGVERGSRKVWASENRDWINAGFWVGFIGSAYSLCRWVAYKEQNPEWKKMLFGMR